MSSAKVSCRETHSPHLAGGIAHNFNNLLTIILGNAEFLRSDIPLHQRERLEAIVRAAERAADLTRLLLAYAGNGIVFPAGIDVSACIEVAIPSLRASVVPDAILNWQLTRGLPLTHADCEDIHQIVLSLVLNAAEAAPEQDRAVIRVRTGLCSAAECQLRDELTGKYLKTSDYVEIAVSDSGTGMDRETKARIFEPFFTTKSFGRGLGLSAVAGIVGRCGGAIVVNSSPGKGTEFRVLLPVPDGPNLADVRKIGAGRAGRAMSLSAKSKKRQGDT